MIICHIITAFDFGGAEKLLVNTANLQQKNHQVHIIYLKGEAKLAALLAPDIRLHHIALGLATVRQIRKFLIQLKPDILHTHLGHADLIGLYASRGLPLTRICTMHNVWFKFNYLDRIIFLCYTILFKFIVPNCKVTGVSRAIVNHVEKRLGVQKKNIFYIPNAIPDFQLNLSKEALRQELNIAPDIVAILFIGRLRLQKSVDTLIEAAAVLKEDKKIFKIIILGEGHLEDALKNKADELDVSELIDFRGVSLEPDKFLLACDIFVLPSVFEGLPTVILEAFRARIPVIASDIDGSNDLIRHQANGLLFPARSSNSLARHFQTLIDNPEMSLQLGQAGFKVFQEKYTIPNYVSALEKLYTNNL